MDLARRAPVVGLFDRRRTTPTQVTFGQMSSASPVFSPDGKTLYVIGEERRGELQHVDKRSMQFVAFPEGSLWRSRLDGSERLQLTFPPVRAGAPRWSPDGKTIALHAMVPRPAPRDLDNTRGWREDGTGDTGAVS